MPATKEIKAGKTNKYGGPQALPTAKDLKSFAKRFTQQEWIKVCGVQAFLDIVGYDLFGAKLMAEMILAGKWDREKFDRKLRFAKRRKGIK